jgi:hypothetical protein
MAADIAGCFLRGGSHYRIDDEGVICYIKEAP